MPRILIIDDEPAICWSLKERLTDQGYEVQVAGAIERANKILAGFTPDVIVVDVRLPGQDGLSAIPEFRKQLPTTPIVVMTAFGDLETVVDAMGRGAFDYLVKPFELPDFLSVIARAIQSLSHPATSAAGPWEGGRLIGRGVAMQALFKQIALVAPTAYPVLITGETGTGKELVAEALHRHSLQKNGPFVRVSLASLSPSVIESELFGHVKGAFTGAAEDRRGLFELAEDGTIFLDEIGETPPGIQVKLLRILESHAFSPVGGSGERTTNARLIAATNRNVDEMIASGQFREDLYHRLKVFSIVLPPLRDHLEDLPFLVEYFAGQHPQSTRLMITAEFMATLQQRTWSGYVRELRNAVDHAVVLSRGGALAPEHLPPWLPIPCVDKPAGEELEAAIGVWVQRQLAQQDAENLSDLYRRFLSVAESALLSEVLASTQQNRSAAAKILGLDRATLRAKLGAASGS